MTGDDWAVIIGLLTGGALVVLGAIAVRIVTGGRRRG